MDERRATMMVFAGTLLALSLLLLVGLLPLRAKREEQARRLQELEVRLRPFEEREHGTPLARKIQRETSELAALRASMNHLLQIKDTFKGHSPVARVVPTMEEGRIDFKVALFHARSVLTERAENSGVRIPPGLGMEETIGADEPAENRLWHLAAIMRLIEHALETGIPEVEAIETLPVRVTPLPHPEFGLLREFPVRIILHCNYSQLLRYLARLNAADHFFTVWRFRFESKDPARPDLLRATIVCSAGQPRALPPAAPAVEDIEEETGTLRRSRRRTEGTPGLPPPAGNDREDTP